MDKPISFRRYFHVTIIITALLIVSFLCLTSAILLIGGYVGADIYVNENIAGTGDWSTLHEGRLSEASGGKNSSMTYAYDKTVTEEGAHSQNVKLMMFGGEASSWNYQRVWTDDMVAGSQSMNIWVRNIKGSYYGENGMDITYNEANDSREEFVSTTTIDSRDGSASISFDVIQWQGQGNPIPQFDEETGNFTGYAGGESMGKPVSISELDIVGKFLVEQIVKLQEPITNSKGWLEFCDTLDDDLPDGYMVLPSDLKYDWKNGTAFDLNTSQVYQIDK